MLKTFLRRILRFCYQTVGTAKVKAFPTDIDDAELLKSLKDFDSLEEFVNHVRSKGRPSVFVDFTQAEALAGLAQRQFPDLCQKAVKKADSVCDHIFDILGSGPTEVEKDGEVDWLTDFKTGRRWRLVHYKAVTLEDLDSPSDIKVPWELSRCQHFVTLGQVYWFTGDEKYAKEFIAEVRSWLKSNPVKLGVNWACSMEVGIRAANWAVAFQYFLQSPSMDDSFIVEFFSALLLKGRHIRANLEYGQPTTNHYLSDIVGLLYIAIMFPESGETEMWKDFAVEELKKEMRKQVRSDGMDFEGSTCYHRLGLELFFFATLLCVVNHKDFEGSYSDTAVEVFGSDFVNRLRKMFEFALYTMKPDGMIPQIGDNDSGRLHVLSEKPVLDWRYLLNFGAIFFNDPKFRLKEAGLSEDVLWVFGEHEYRRLAEISPRSVAGLKSSAFGESGIYVIREKEVYLLVHCGPNGQDGVGGHDHNDALSFELNVDGADVIVDPGTYVYTADYRARNKYRSSVVHNSVTIDSSEPNRFDEKELFKVEDDSRPKVLKWGTCDGRFIFEGEHYGYMRFGQPVVHRRHIEYQPRQRKVYTVDRFEGRGRHTFVWNLTLSPSAPSSVKVTSDVLKWVSLPALYSPQYGVEVPTKCLKARINSAVPAEFSFEIALG